MIGRTVTVFGSVVHAAALARSDDQTDPFAGIIGLDPDYEEIDQDGRRSLHRQDSQDSIGHIFWGGISDSPRGQGNNSSKENSACFNINDNPGTTFKPSVRNNPSALRRSFHFDNTQHTPEANNNNHCSKKQQQDLRMADDAAGGSVLDLSSQWGEYTPAYSDGDIQASFSPMAKGQRPPLPPSRRQDQNLVFDHSEWRNDLPAWANSQPKKKTTETQDTPFRMRRWFLYECQLVLNRVYANEFKPVVLSDD